MESFAAGEASWNGDSSSRGLRKKCNETALRTAMIARLKATPSHRSYCGLDPLLRDRMLLLLLLLLSCASLFICGSLRSVSRLRFAELTRALFELHPAFLDATTSRRSSRHRRRSAIQPPLPLPPQSQHLLIPRLRPNLPTQHRRDAIGFETRQERVCFEVVEEGEEAGPGVREGGDEERRVEGGVAEHFVGW